MECQNCRQDGYKQKMRETTDQFSYKECGLNNVFLKNWQGLVCPRCSLSVPSFLPNAELASCLIAREVLLSGAVLNGNQILFLRKLMKLSPAESASLLGVDLDYFDCIEADKAVLKKVDEVKLKTIISGYVVLSLNRVDDITSRVSGCSGCLVAVYRLASCTLDGKIFVYMKVC